MKGRTYSLRDDSGATQGYYRRVAETADRLLAGGQTPESLRELVRRSSRSFARRLGFGRRAGHDVGRGLDGALSPFTCEAPILPLARGVRGIADPILRSSRRQHHLYMLEIELTNRINREAFARAPWRMVLLAHCLRDFHADCAAFPGAVEEVCGRCRRDCLIRLGSDLAERHGVHPFIAATMDHERLFEGLARVHPGMAVMGVACVPELAMGMRLTERLGIPAVGVPLDANRCARWCKEAGETAFSLSEMERLMGGG